MSTGNIITLVALAAFAVFVIYFVVKSRREAKQIALSKKHGPRTGAPEFDRAEQIQKGGINMSIDS
jgi:hypothetical protein